MDCPRFDQFWSEKGLKEGGTAVFRGELMYLKDNTNFNLKLIFSGKVYLFGWELTYSIPHSAYLYEVMERIKGFQEVNIDWQKYMLIKHPNLKTEFQSVHLTSLN